MKALADCIRTYDDALPAAFCQQLIDNFEASAPFQMPNGRGYRPALDDSRLMSTPAARILSIWLTGTPYTRSMTSTV